MKYSDDAIDRRTYDIRIGRNKLSGSEDRQPDWKQQNDDDGYDQAQPWLLPPGLAGVLAQPAT